MRILIFSCLFLLGLSQVQAQNKAKIYHPEADAKKDIVAALAQAKQEGKHVVLQIGGNWCSWCIKFNNYIQQDSLTAAIVQDNFVYYHLNYSKGHENHDLLTKYNFPQRFGFPVMVILDADGKHLHTQDSWMLEDGKGSYNKELVPHFFKSWTPKAVDPKTYKKRKRN